MDRGGAHRHDRAFAFGEGASQPALRRSGASAEGLQRRIGERSVRFYAQMRLQLLDIDGPSRSRTHIQGQPLDLLAHQPALAGQAGDEGGQGVRGQAHLVDGESLACHAGDVAGLILVDGDPDRTLAGLGRLAQGGIAAQGSGLDHQHAVGIVAAVGMDLERRRQHLVDRGFLRPQPHADQPASADHRQGGQGLFQPGLVAVDVAVGQQGDVERVVQIGGDGPAQDLCALGDAGAVLAVDDGGADPGVRLRQEAVDLGPLGQDHWARIMGRREPASGRRGSAGPVRRRRGPRRPAGPRWRHRAGRRRRRWW